MTRSHLASRPSMRSAANFTGSEVGAVIFLRFRLNRWTFALTIYVLTHACEAIHRRCHRPFLVLDDLSVAQAPVVDRSGADQPARRRSDHRDFRGMVEYSLPRREKRLCLADHRTQGAGGSAQRRGASAAQSLGHEPDRCDPAQLGRWYRVFAL